jgi:N-glycosylase/DNA lyase
MLQYLDRNKFYTKDFENLIKYSKFKCKMNFNYNEIDEYNILLDAFLNGLLLNYFQMEVNLPKIHYDISNKLPSNMLNVIKNLEGVRIVKQDVFECVISFICSSNNNIERIKKMLNSLRETHGEKIFISEQYGDMYSFPTLKVLINKLTENKLRDLGFGYRAKYIINSLEIIDKEGEDWLYQLNGKEKIWEDLVKLNGVGRKVADCISLFSLRKHEIVPLDIHMIKFYNETVVKLDKKHKKIESLTKNVYEKVSDIYSETFGEYAGWVHSVFYLNRVDKERPDYLKENNNSEKEIPLKTQSKSGKKKSQNYEEEKVSINLSKRKKK